MKRDGSVVRYAYDALARITQKVVPGRGDLPTSATRSVFYGYDLQGHQTYARFDNATGEGVTNAWDGFGRQTSSTLTMDGVSRTMSYQYDADSNRTAVTFSDGNYTVYTYDGLDRPTLIQRSGSATIASYAYDTAGRRWTMGGGVSTTYGYDGINRVTSIANTLTNATYNNSYGFSYNPASQITSLNKSNNIFAFAGTYNVNRSYTVNGLNQYTSAGAATFSYDANGNLTSDGSTTFLYDIENRLVGASGAHVAALRYDPLGRLYETLGSSGTTRFLYDGDALVGEYDAGGTLLRRYVHGADGTADDPVAWYEGSAFSGSSERILRQDWQGSIALITDNTGASVYGVNTYDEYGIPGSGNTGRFQYTGQAWQSDLGMYHYKARFYSPTLGRFLQTDPIGYKDQVNLYAYVANDPVNGTDPTGVEGDDDWKKRVVDVVIGTAKVATGAVLTAVGVAGDGASAVGEVATAGAATPVAVPAAIASTAVAATGIAMAADGASQISGAIMRSTPAGSDGGGSNGGGKGGDLSGHAQDRMGQQGVTPDRVQEAQQIGRVKPGNTADTVVREVPSATSAGGRGIRIVMDRATGRVITVMDKGSKFR